jgi:hypothetical protein
VPSFRPASPPPPAFSTQPPLQWAPPPAMGLTPGRRSLTARCYAGANIRPLAQPDHVGVSCSCDTAVTGRPLIPPSHEIGGRPLRRIKCRTRVLQSNSASIGQVRTLSVWRPTGTPARPQRIRGERRDLRGGKPGVGTTDRQSLSATGFAIQRALANARSTALMRV